MRSPRSFGRNPKPPGALFCAKSDARTKGAPSLRTIGAFLTVRQVAEQLRVSPATVYALVERGEIAHVRVSNVIRIAPDALAAYLAPQSD